MKIFLLAFACIIVVSCSKSNTQDQQAVTGKWELRQSTGGIAGNINYEPGNGNKLVFYDDKSFQSASVYAPSKTGSYSIKASARKGDWILTFQFMVNGQSQSETDSVRFGDNQLIFLPQETCCDIPTTLYERYN